MHHGVDPSHRGSPLGQERATFRGTHPQLSDVVEAGVPMDSAWRGNRTARLRSNLGRTSCPTSSRLSILTTIPGILFDFHQVWLGEDAEESPLIGDYGPIRTPYQIVDLLSDFAGS